MPGDGEGEASQKLVTGASERGDEVRGKRTELSRDADLLREGSGGSPASKKSPKHVNSLLPVL